MIGSLVNIGIIQAIGRRATSLMGENYFGAATWLLMGTTAISGVVDNIPYVATLAPMTADLVRAGARCTRTLVGRCVGGSAWRKRDRYRSERKCGDDR